jgi:hypothetical protein
VIRRKGAEGTLPLPVEETIEVLILLAAGPDADVRSRAAETLGRWNHAEVRRVLASPLTASDVLRYAAEQSLARREDLLEVLLSNPALPAETRSRLQPKRPSEPSTEKAADPILAKLTAALEQEDAKALAELPAGIEAPPEVTKRDDELTKVDRETLIQKISHMSSVEKIKAALTGNLETRMILVRDPNKVVSRAVLQSPKLSETEIENYAASKSVAEEVLRLIAMNRKFMKLYVVVRALVNNPRAPIDITLPLVIRLNDRDLKTLTFNRNVPDVIRTMAMKIIKQKEDAAKPKLPGKH